MSKPCKSKILELALSDHTAQVLETSIRNTTDEICSWRIRKRDMSEENINKFKDCLHNLSFSDIYNTTDPNQAYNSFYETFKLFYNLCFPFKLIKINTKHKPQWVSKGIKNCSKKKRLLLWAYRLKPTNRNKLNYTLYSRRLKRIIKLTQLAQNNYSINTSKNIPKTTWRIVNNKLQQPFESISKIINDANKVITDPQIISNAFNNYFIDNIKPLPGHGTKITTHITQICQSIFMAPSTPSDIMTIITQLANKNSVGYDDVSTNVIKSVKGYISSHLSHILNLCIDAGVYPNALKVSIVKPILKKQEPLYMENYRPITLIPIFSKIFEKFLYNQIYTYLEKLNILTDEQKGFRRNKTINNAIYDFLNVIVTKVDVRIPTCAIFCDMAQAFDYVDHEILLEKLNTYGVRGNVLKLISSYLHNRQQYVEIKTINTSRLEESFKSEIRVVKYGVPQGSVLGPLLFIIYINDLPKVTNKPMSLFADDSAIIIENTNKININNYETDINTSLANIIEWMTNNNLKINISKTKLIHFRQRVISQRNMNINYQNNQIDEVEATKFLGLTIDRQMNWKAHTDNLCKKISKSAYALHRLRTIIY